MGAIDKEGHHAGQGSDEPAGIDYRNIRLVSTMQVKDLMSRQVLTIGTSDSCLEAVGRMHRARVRHLPVVNRDGLLVGVVTDRDLRHHLFSPGVFKELGETAVEILLKAVPVAEIMSTSVISVTPQEE